MAEFVFSIDVLHFLNDKDILQLTVLSPAIRGDVLLRETEARPVQLWTCPHMSMSCTFQSVGLWCCAQPWEVPRYLREFSCVCFLSHCELATARDLRSFSSALHESLRWGAKSISGPVSFFFSMFTFPATQETHVEGVGRRVLFGSFVSSAVDVSLLGDEIHLELNYDMVHPGDHWWGLSICRRAKSDKDDDIKELFAVCTKNGATLWHSFVESDQNHLEQERIYEVPTGSYIDLALRRGQSLPFIIAVRSDTLLLEP